MFLLFPMLNLKAETINDFVDYVADNFDKINTIRNKEEWTKKAYDFSNEILDIDWIAKFILGKHRRSLTDAQIKEFIEAYSKYLLESYLETLTLLSLKNLNVKNVKEQKKDIYFVEVELDIEAGKVNSNLRIVNKNNRYFITDIIAENVSFINAQRSEIDSFLSTNGFDALIKKIRE